MACVYSRAFLLGVRSACKDIDGTPHDNQEDAGDCCGTVHQRPLHTVPIDHIMQRDFASRQGLNESNDELHKTLRRKRLVSILNKVAPDNLDTLCVKIHAECQADAMLAESLPRLLHQRALAGECYIKTYAELIARLRKLCSSLPEQLLRECKAEFSRMNRDKMLANVSFVGYLVSLNVFPYICIDGILRSLVDTESKTQDQKKGSPPPPALPSPLSVSVACALWSIGGVRLTMARRQFYLTLWHRLQALKDDQGKFVYPSKIRYEILDAIELPQRQWQPRRHATGSLPQ